MSEAARSNRSGAQLTSSSWPERADPPVLGGLCTCQVTDRMWPRPYAGGSLGFRRAGIWQAALTAAGADAKPPASGPPNGRSRLRALPDRLPARRSALDSAAAVDLAALGFRGCRRPTRVTCAVPKMIEWSPRARAGRLRLGGRRYRLLNPFGHLWVPRFCREFTRCLQSTRGVTNAVPEPGLVVRRRGPVVPAPFFRPGPGLSRVPSGFSW
jgi:hypothetical protein